jgi:hypothetical protein
MAGNKKEVMEKSRVGENERKGVIVDEIIGATATSAGYRNAGDIASRGT